MSKVALAPKPAPAEVRRHWLLHNLALEQALGAIVTAFRAHGIDHVVLKGIPQVRRLGLDLAARRIGDNDILVRRHDVRRAYDVLRGLGYEPHPYLRLESQLRRSFQYPMRRQDGLWVEIHWSAFDPSLFAVDEQIQWEHTEPWRSHGVDYVVFDRFMSTLHLASHFVQHQMAELRILRELGVAWSIWYGSPHDQERLARLARRVRVLDALSYGILLAQDRGFTSSAAVPALITRRAALLRRLLPAESIPTHGPRRYHGRAACSLLVAHANRIPHWLLRNLLPPSDVLAHIYDEPHSPRLYARYVTRLFRPLRRTLSKGPPQG